MKYPDLKPGQKFYFDFRLGTSATFRKVFPDVYDRVEDVVVGGVITARKGQRHKYGPGHVFYDADVKVVG